MTTSWRFFADLAERTVRTFLQAYLGTWLIVGAEWDTLFTANNLKAATVVAALAVATAIGAKGFSNPSSASVLPPAAQPIAEPAPVGDARSQLSELREKIGYVPAPSWEVLPMPPPGPLEPIGAAQMVPPAPPPR